ncbi:hypothetical protein K474DRAFT_1677317 [Panus rudis PR-1116 ss-1]|nr:hypothetical protein K474DRAFT_1677317 [Panus rudis PR-1116 ss-1]
MATAGGFAVEWLAPPGAEFRTRGRGDPDTFHGTRVLKLALKGRSTRGTSLVGERHGFLKYWQQELLVVSVDLEEDTARRLPDRVAVSRRRKEPISYPNASSKTIARLLVHRDFCLDWLASLTGVMYWQKEEEEEKQEGRGKKSLDNCSTGSRIASFGLRDQFATNAQLSVVYRHWASFSAGRMLTTAATIQHQTVTGDYHHRPSGG